jgi:hypothetical protein
MYKATYKGRYRVNNTSKYRGDVNEVIYRSSWECKFMKWCDNNPAVLEWGSEIMVIPYKSPVDNKIHRYFVDFYIKVKDRNGHVLKYLIEIKPERFTKPPEIPKRQSKKFIDEVFLYGQNQAKWKAADEYCSSRGMKFMVLTEKDLGIPR